MNLPLIPTIHFMINFKRLVRKSDGVAGRRASSPLSSRSPDPPLTASAYNHHEANTAPLFTMPHHSIHVGLGEAY